ncbi:hypothetical protein DFO73_10912 [Cytobacillus oceanisediminis]|jgi:uncharacterized coiled-coil DUF342 family protein|uniref:Uncharacterized protein n=1 Tax=Cytobacillus oceanisediminis TaxID=665099 RepID=A0A2V2ZR96_9BACI|nr:hypothetical protein [Cytobacillus oceanisediminis]PWW26849.1 hypothetical protein DFO73_10912 [Cytobacillus oceanisediminis]
MMDNKKISQYLNDIQNLSAAEKELDTCIGKLREAQLKYRDSMSQLYSWKAGEAKERASQWSADFFLELSKKIHRLEDKRYDIIQTRKRLDSLMRAEISSGPKW